MLFRVQRYEKFAICANFLVESLRFKGKENV